jgi:hypothetical protein
MFMIKFKNILAAGLAILLTTPSFAQITSVSEQTVDKNYITNGGFEHAKAGWVTYKNTAQAMPVTGAGGTPSVTLAASTSSPIAGKSSGVLTKGASNLQGEGVSYAFSVDPAAKGRVLTVSGLYQIISGTYSGGSPGVDSDIEAYIYDVDGAQVIQPAGYKLDGGVSGISYQLAATFQTSTTSTNYKLILHVATVSSLAYSLKLDSMKVSVQSKSQGPPVTDPIEWTPTLTGFGGVTSVKFFKMRVGSIEHIWGSFKSGTADASTATISLPSNINLALLKATGSQRKKIGTVLRGTSSGTTTMPLAATGPWVIFGDSSNTALGFLTNSSNATGGVDAFITQTGASLVVFGDIVDIDMWYPVLGASSTTTVSDSSDTRIVLAKAIGSSASVATNGIIIPQAVTNDTHGSYNLAAGQYKVPVPGYYKIYGSIRQSTANTFTMYVYKNGVINDELVGINATTSAVSFSTVVFCNAGDLLDLRINNGPVTFSNVIVTYEKASGPSQIAASESVNLRYENSAGTSVTTTTTILPYGSKVYDSHGAYNASTGVFTAPISGKYKINARYTSSTSASCYILTYKNGVVNGQSYVSTAGGAQTYAINDTVQLLAGDTMDVRAATVTGSTTLNSAASFNTLEIERVGN